MNKSRHTDGALIRAAVVVGSLLVGLVVGLGVGLFQSPSYQSTAYVAVVPASSGVDQTTATKFAAAYARVAASPSVLTTPEPQTGTIDPTVAARALQVTANPDAPLIELVATRPDPGAAAALADGVAARLIGYADAQAPETGVRVIPFVQAVPAVKPSGPNVAVDVAVGAAAGLLIGGLLLLAAPAPPARDGPASHGQGAAAPLPRPQTTIDSLDTDHNPAPRERGFSDDVS